METKCCSKCKKELSITEFRWRNKLKGKLHSQCKECERKADKERYANSLQRRENVLATAHYQRDRNLNIVNQYKSLGCAKCKENRIYLMEFHHKNPSEKENTIAHMIKSSSEEKLINELNKCVVLCANCHREFHHFERINNISLEEYLSEQFIVLCSTNLKD